MMNSLKGLKKALILIPVILTLIPRTAFAQDIIDSISISRNLKNENFLNAIQSYNNGEYDRATTLLYKVLGEDKGNDAAYYYLASIAIRNKDLPSGELLVKKAIEIDSSNYWYRDLYAKLLIASNRIGEAIGIYEGLIETYPSKTDIYYTLINLYLGQNDIEKSKETLDKIETVSGKTEATALARFNIFSIHREWNEAIEYLTEFDREFPSPKIEALIGDLYTNVYNDSLALHYYNKALENAPDFDLAKFGIAEIYRRNGEYESYFKHIIPFVSNPNINTSTLRDYLTGILSTPGFIKNGGAALDTMIWRCTSTHQADSALSYICASYFYQTGDSEKSIEILKKNCELFPNDLPPFFVYLSMLFRNNDWQTVEQAGRQAIEKFGENPNIIEAIGLSYYHREMKERAIESYNYLINVLRRDGRDTSFILSAYTTLADMYHDANQSKQSFANYEKALKIDKNYLPALNNYAYYLSLHNQKMKKALAMSKITIEKEPDNPTYVDTYAWILYLMGQYPEAKAMLKHAMLYGGTESGDILDHYAEVLYAMKEYDLAFIYWEQAKAKGAEGDIAEKIEKRKAAIERK